MTESIKTPSKTSPLEKTASGIAGLDEITGGGLPNGRPTLVCGGPGCGKTVLAMEFLVHGAAAFDEPGLFVSFEENPRDLLKDFRSFGFGMDVLIENKKLKFLHVALSREEIVEAGSFSLEALLIRLEHAIKEVGAKRIVLDTMETIFSVLQSSETLRGEIARLFHWIRNKGITAVVTGEAGKEGLTRYGFEEYLSDCVIILDHRVVQQISKRRLRVLKYRGSFHAKDEFPFLIGKDGLFVFPITSVSLNSPALRKRISTGVPDLDGILGGKGYYKGSTVLISGGAGTGKSSLGMAFASKAWKAGEPCLYFSFEESTSQLARNMKSVGIDIDPGLKNGKLRIQAFRPSYRGLEEHLLAIMQVVEEFEPACVVMDPISDFASVGGHEAVRSMLARVIDFLKHKGITLILTALSSGTWQLESGDSLVSSLVDTWLSINLREVGNLHRREIIIVKSRGMEHSRDTFELLMSGKGLSCRKLKRNETS